jgi:hypothetical protein
VRHVPEARFGPSRVLHDALNALRVLLGGDAALSEFRSRVALTLDRGGFRRARVNRGGSTPTDVAMSPAAKS